MFGKKKKEEINKTILQESFRTLRANINFCGLGSTIKTITITSCTFKEGKTTTAFNLAKSLASAGTKTLLVDFHLSLEAMNNRDIDKFTGIPSPILNDLSIEYAASKTKVKNLEYFLISEKYSSIESFLDSGEIEQFIKRIKDKYDVAIFDAPSLDGSINSTLIASHTDGTILVIQSGLHDYITVKRAKEQLEKANANILGVVLSKMHKGNFKEYYNYQKYFHNRGLKKNNRPNELVEINNIQDIPLKPWKVKA